METNWRETLSPLDPYNQRVLFTIFALFGKPTTLLDVGSGTGIMVNTARALGVNAIGIDNNGLGGEFIIQRDLSSGPVIFKNPPLRFDMILCLEVGEHLPEYAAPNLIHTISDNANMNTRLIFSSATPNQGGNGHVNEKPATWWRDLLYRTGRWSYRDDLTAKLSLMLSHTAGPMSHWLPANVQVF